MDKPIQYLINSAFLLLTSLMELFKVLMEEGKVSANLYAALGQLRREFLTEIGRVDQEAAEEAERAALNSLSTAHEAAEPDHPGNLLD